MAKGWRNESRRHSLAARGVKTAVDHKPIERIPITPMKKYSIEYTLVTWKRNPKTQMREPQEERIVFPNNFNDRKKAEKLLESFSKNEKPVIIEINDSDGDGMPDNLDCDPNDPEKQGFFDDLKTRLVKQQKMREFKDMDKRWEKEDKLRKDLEEREEELEKQKEEKLLKLNTKLEEKRGIAEIKAKEKELDRIQEELEEGSFKQRLRTNLSSLSKKAGILAVKGAKRVGEELGTKERKKYTEVNLTEKEKARTSTATQKKLYSQQKKNAELEAKITLNKLKKEEKLLKKQLKETQTKRRKKKKEKGLFD